MYAEESTAGQATAVEQYFQKLLLSWIFF
jgi:hypothetical protein